MKPESSLIPKWIRKFAADCCTIKDSERIHPDEGLMPIVIQSRSFDETDWSDEVWRRTHFEAFAVAKHKAKLTGRIYRLVNDEGVVLEEVRHLGSSFGRGAD